MRIRKELANFLRTANMTELDNSIKFEKCIDEDFTVVLILSKKLVNKFIVKGERFK